MVTLTMRHRAGQQLADLWSAVSYAWGCVTSGRAWKDAAAAYGVQDEQGQDRLHTIRVVEVTHGQNGWHVHVHALLFTRHQLQDATLEVVAREMFGRWSRALTRKGMEAPLVDFGGLEAHPVEGDVQLLGDYLTKQTYDGPNKAAVELTRGDLKEGRGGNRTPFQILGHVVELGVVDDLALWREWEQGSKGRRQIAWSKGLRALVAVEEVELTDEQVAELDEGGEVLIWAAIEGEGLRQLVHTPGLITDVLDLLERRMVQEAADLLDHHDVPWSFTDAALPYLGPARRPPGE